MSVADLSPSCVFPVEAFNPLSDKVGLSDLVVNLATLLAQSEGCVPLIYWY